MSTNNNNKNPTQSGDVLWKQDVYGKDGDNRILAGSIEFQAAANATSGAVASKMVVKTADSTGALAAALTVDSSQQSQSYRKVIVPVMGNSKVGATAGWVVTAGTNISHATLPASQSGSTLVVGVDGLNVGDVLNAVAAVGQIESAGNAVSCTMSVRTLTASAAAALTDAAIGSDAHNASADTLLTDANGNLKATGIDYTVVATAQVYVLFTCTTAASTDIDLSHLVLTVNSA